MRGSLIDWWLMVLMCHGQSIQCIHHVETLKPVKNCCSAAASANQRLPDISRRSQLSQLSQPKFATSNELIWQCLWYVIAFYIYIYIYTYIYILPFYTITWPWPSLPHFFATAPWPGPPLVRFRYPHRTPEEEDAWAKLSRENMVDLDLISIEFDHQGFTIWLFNTAMERSTIL